MCHRKHIYIKKIIIDQVTYSTSYYKPHKKYHPGSISCSFSPQNIEKIGTSKHILNAEELGLLWPKGKYPANSLCSLCSVLHALRSTFCCYRPETEENHSPGEGTVPGEQLQEDLRNQRRDERDAWASCSSEPWGKKRL